MYRNTRMQRKKKKSKVVNLYLKPEYEETYYQMAEYLNREGKSFSDWVWQRVRKFVELHKAGNSQQTLTHIIETGLPYRAPDECHLCGSIADREVHYRGNNVRTCFSCYRDIRREHGHVGYRMLNRK